jgi:hypothetical protein
MDRRRGSWPVHVFNPGRDALQKTALGGAQQGENKNEQRQAKIFRQQLALRGPWRQEQQTARQIGLCFKQLAIGRCFHQRRRFQPHAKHDHRAAEAFYPAAPAIAQPPERFRPHRRHGLRQLINRHSQHRALDQIPNP